jgi:hypothetical protein
MTNSCAASAAAEQFVSKPFRDSRMAEVRTVVSSWKASFADQRAVGGEAIVRFCGWEVEIELAGVGGVRVPRYVTRG